MSSDLRPYQAQAEKEIFEAWKSGLKNIMFQLVTGGGKTVLFVDIIRKFVAKGRRVILIAHREELITQAWDTLYKNEIYAGVIKADVKPNYSMPCQVASIQTLIRRKNLPPADLIIIDEAHHSQDDNSYGQVIANHFAESFVLGVTATPYRLGGKGFTDVFQKLICSISFKDLVNQGWLVPIRYFVASRPDLSKVNMSKGDYENEALGVAMGNAPLIESYFEHCKGMCGAVFAVNIEHSLKIVDQYNAAGVPAAHLDANTPTEKRKQLLKNFKEGKIRIISNVGIITEGFDFPNMEFVQLARPTKSLALYLQMVGRVTRTDYNVIKHAVNDEHRCQLISLSKKPCGIVLDNASLFEEHGLPDQDFNWQVYFEGIPKRKKKEITDEIEMIEYVAEDTDGRVVKSQLPSEIEGLKLIEVTHSIKEKIIRVTSLKELDKNVEMFKRMPKLGNKAGFAAYKAYREYCRKNNILITEEMWDYMINKLSVIPESELSRVKSDSDKNIEFINSQYAHNPDDLSILIQEIRAKALREETPFKKMYVPSGYLKRERAEYESQNLKSKKSA
jgi:superfamily II DNA or RNA helicase